VPSSPRHWIPKFVVCLCGLVAVTSLAGVARATSDGHWYQISTANSPGELLSPLTVYDSYGKRMLLFGGLRSDTLRNDVWQLNLDCSTPNWVKVTTSGTKPIPRAVLAGIYDPTHKQLVLDGGSGGDTSTTTVYLGDTWRLSLDGGTPTWLRIDSLKAGYTCYNGHETTHFCPREGHRAVYSTNDDKMWVFGGAGCSMYNDTHVGTVTTSSVSWTGGFSGVHCYDVYTDDDVPQGRDNHSMIYDTRHHVAVVLGGAYDVSGPAECWESTTSGGEPWTQLSTPPDNLERLGHIAVYDSLRARMLVLGGCGSDSVIALSLPDSGTPTWSTLHPQGTKPPSGAVGSAVGILDPDGDRMIVFGTDGNTYALDFDDTPPDTIADLAVKSTTSAKVYIKWTAPTDDGPKGKAQCYDIRYSSTGDIDESSFASATQWTTPPTPSTYPAKDSVQVTGLTNGVTYAFAVKSKDYAGNWSVISNVVNATPCAPGGCPESMRPSTDEGGARVAFGLDEVVPTPSNGTLRVTFRLPVASGAKLDLVDVAGRSIRKVEVSSFGPGQHTIDLTRGTPLPAGYYIVRLRQGTQVATRSAIVVR
jgi:Fibronectin type III domain